MCKAYLEAKGLLKAGTHVVCTDEKTGIQALKTIAPTKPPRPGLVERREFEYERNGTLCLIPSYEVATGKIIASSIGPTRTEEDFHEHIKKTVATDPEAKWIFICDQLNTHKSESLVRWVNEVCGLNKSEEELGKRARRGILGSLKTRTEFLSDKSHRIRFLYTPKHCSWMNQVEIWFGILQAKVIKRGNFSTLGDLKNKIEMFIDYFSEHLAKPFKWKYKGFPLKS